MNADAAGRPSVPRRPGFTQVAVFEGTTVGDNPDGFVAYMEQQCGVRVQFLEEIEVPVRLSGGGLRHDVFFAIHEQDLPKLNAARERAAAGPATELRWLEDVLMPINYPEPIYPSRVFDYVVRWPEIAPGMEFVADAHPDPAAVAAALQGDAAPPRKIRKVH
jgi:hypothetical protein